MLDAGLLLCTDVLLLSRETPGSKLEFEFLRLITWSNKVYLIYVHYNGVYLELPRSGHDVFSKSYPKYDFPG